MCPGGYCGASTVPTSLCPSVDQCGFTSFILGLSFDLAFAYLTYLCSAETYWSSVERMYIYSSGYHIGLLMEGAIMPVLIKAVLL